MYNFFCITLSYTYFYVPYFPVQKITSTTASCTRISVQHLLYKISLCKVSRRTFSCTSFLYNMTCTISPAHYVLHNIFLYNNLCTTSSTHHPPVFVYAQHVPVQYFLYNIFLHDTTLYNKSFSCTTFHVHYVPV